MAKITELTEQTVITGTDVIPVAGSDGTAKKMSLTTLLAWLKANHKEG